MQRFLDILNSHTGRRVILVSNGPGEWLKVHHGYFGEISKSDSEFTFTMTAATYTVFPPIANTILRPLDMSLLWSDVDWHGQTIDRLVVFCFDEAMDDIGAIRDQFRQAVFDLETSQKENL